MLKYVFSPVHRAGWPFVGIAVAVMLVLAWVHPPLGWLGLGLVAFVAYFFRDPVRTPPIRAGLIVSPADGVVTAVGPARPPPELELPEVDLVRVSVFLSVLDVHVNRVPTDGTVVRSEYHPGKFLSATLDKASEENERQSITLRTPSGELVSCVQIAGLIARRIICNLEVGQQVRAGERFGLIRFGSRTDVYLPVGTAPLVAVGQRMIGGETVIADLWSDEPARSAEER